MVEEHNNDDDLDQDSADIAIVGMACRFPGADNPAQYWDNLQRGHESMTELSDEELTASGVSKEHLKDPNYVKSGMFLQHMELFDAGFFGFSPMDAKLMDPQHRHFLECSWEAFEDAGYDPATVNGSVGVFGGSGHNAYMPYNLLTNPDLVDDVGFFLVRHTGNDKDFLTTRVSYCFDLKGPSINLQTACSTSLVAVHTATQSLLNGECDMALAGGVTIDLPHRRGYLFKDSEILSSDGHCRPFDANSKGTVFGSGVGAVVLRRLKDALVDGDNIHAVLKATAVNNDGAGKVSYLAPSVDGQAAAIHEALEIGDIDPRTVEYIECHGTGTQLGDPIEVAALTQAYGAGHEGKQYCAIGSVKSNIGHLDTAAGVASLIKVVLALKHRKMPPTLHYRVPNPSIDFSASPFFVNADLRDWHSDTLRRAGVSSLGVGGTNAHVIVEEAPAPVMAQRGRDWQLLLLSARSDQALQKSNDRLAEFLDGEDEPPQLANVAFTLATGRRGFSKRRFAVVQSRQDAVAVLDGSEKNRAESAESPGNEYALAFMFAGGGTQYAGMGAGLYAGESVFRSVVDECLQLLHEFIDYDLKALLYPLDDAAQAAGQELQRPSRSLPALFVTQYAQARLWMSMGVQPKALIGHSMGENTAACLAGVLSLKDALGLVALRGQLFETVPEGGMLSVQLKEEELQSLLAPGLSVAAQNAPGLSVVSGPKQALEELENLLAAREVSCQRVHIDIAAHSSMLEPILEAFGDYLRSVQLNTPTIPFVSNLTGAWIKDAEATDPDYWVQHLRQTVRFSDGVGHLLESNKYNLLEVGPGRTLSSLAAMHPGKCAQHTIQSSLRHPDEDIDDLPFMLAALGRLWQGNTDFDRSGLFCDQQRRRVSIPTYAFDRARYWVEPGHSLVAGGLARREQPEQWLYQPTWQRLPQPTLPDDFGGKKFLLLAGEHPLNKILVATLERMGANVVEVRIGDRRQLSDAPFSVRADQSDDFLHLVDALQRGEENVACVIHSLALDVDSQCSLQNVKQQQPLLFDSLFYLAQAVGNEGWEHEQRWLLLTAGGQQVAGEAMGSPLQGLLSGPARVIPHELTNVNCISVDLSLEQCSSPNEGLVRRLLAELVVGGGNAPATIALRGAGRFSLSHQPMAFNCVGDAFDGAAANDVVAVPDPIRNQGVYLITGGTGGLGLVAAETLAQQAAVKVALVARRSLPERQYWQELITQQTAEAPTLERVLALEASGAQVQILQGDVADLESMRVVVDQVREQLGEVNGIIHAAGVIDDDLIQRKEIDQAELVLAPKVKGTLVLQELFDIDTLDFLVLYSSSSAFSGLPGQVDYAAANAFLDSFAHAADDGNVISINWPAWKEVGMAAAIADGSSQRYQPSGRPVDHPLLDRCIQEDDKQAVYSTLFDVDGYWLLNEHRIKEGGALIPGSGFVELARAAFTEARGPGAIELRDLAFELPFFVTDHEFKALRISLFYNADGANFTITSNSDGEWVEHVRGVIDHAEAPCEKLDPQSLLSNCQMGEQTFHDPDHHCYLDFGQRWEVLKKVSYGRHEACIELRVDDNYREELQTMALHPAVLDMATAGAQVIIPDYHAQNELYVPVGYARLQFGGQFSQHMLSHVVYKPTLDSDEHSHDIARFDISVCDSNGIVLLRVEDFTMQRIADVAALKRAVNNAATEVNPGLQRALELGIDAEEGKAALTYILRQQRLPQTAVSVYDFASLQRELLAPFAGPEVEPAEALHDPDSDPEIAEIEQALMNNEALESLVVRSHLDEAGERRLIAHFVPDYDHHITVSELRRYAKEALKSNSLPQQFIELDEMPLNDQGVIDRLQLKDPFAPEDTYVAPRTSTERALAKIWQDTLGLEKVGLNENFFDIGGHSLLSIRIIVRVDKKFGVRLDQATMVLHTLEQIANEIDEQRSDTDAEEAPVSEQLAASEEGNGKESKGIMKKLFGRK